MSKISWTKKTWEVTGGCSPVSDGCKNCYAAQMVGTRLAHLPTSAGLVEKKDNGRYVFTGEVRMYLHNLEIPFRRKKPTTYFVNSRSDLFHEAISDINLQRVWSVMQYSPQHNFIVLTKRPERFASCFERLRYTPLPNVWLGVSVEDQKTAEERISLLLQASADVKFISAEPLLSNIDLTKWLVRFRCWSCRYESLSNIEDNICPACGGDDTGSYHFCPALDWVVVGAESGANRRECKVEWIESIVNQCTEAGVPVFVKQGSHLHPGKQGNIPDKLWNIKEFPR